MEERRIVRARVANACDTCKSRRVKCSGRAPCGYCVRRREPDSCKFTAGRRRQPAAGRGSSVASHQSQNAPSPGGSNSGSVAHLQRHHPTNFEEHEHEETEVPKEARLLCDAQGKLIFIGDCAPLSFFQTVRRLVTSKVDPMAFLPESGGYSALEASTSSSTSASAARTGSKQRPGIKKEEVQKIVKAYLEGTSGMVDLFFGEDLLTRITSEGGESVEEVVNYLVLAVGCQHLESQEFQGKGQEYFDWARDMAFSSLLMNQSGTGGGGESCFLGVASVQAFVLITLFSLGQCQINAAFLFFGIAARAAHSIGIHRTAVNARFGETVGRRRDKLWKSLRVVDLYLSTSMGRPPATSDVDCTVPYGGGEENDLLDAGVQIFLVIESIVLEVYSRRKISPRLTEGISRELRDWSGKWLRRLMGVVESENEERVGAVKVLTSYYYAVILVSRPFLMVEMYRRLSDGGNSGNGESSGKSKLADACIDAAILMVEPVKSLIERGVMTRRAPTVVSWLFAASLVLGVGLMGGFGHIIEKHCRASISCLEYFVQADAHAFQYSLIAKSLLSTALEYLEKREMQERLRRTESSSRIFGLIPRAPRETSGTEMRAQESEDNNTAGGANPGGHNSHLPRSEGPTPGFGFDFESAFLGLTDSAFSRTPDFSMMMGGGSFVGEAENTFGALNLFPLLEGDGHIDLANYF
ncbi:hypothetical protein QBC38DRAFT_360020 [Podospora fimiseda]|uniref:Zn(2)-C6 fungal-type domain-containing protein n=1 Tax=Podospora fimiseda TaxID=252190 RepID=A0AAN7BTJ1_9PEZI|nr:hypothetical protein QBC38DRAFT_360020 [Podospora fimiseda]